MRLPLHLLRIHRLTPPSARTRPVQLCLLFVRSSSRYNHKPRTIIQLLNQQMMNAATSVSSTATSTELRKSASLLLLSASNKILFIKRPQAGSFSWAHVFPGGVASPDDGSDLRITALRETFEETNLLLTRHRHGIPAYPQLWGMRERVHDGELRFKDLLMSRNLKLLAKEDVLQFSKWITPKFAVIMGKRFENTFYIARLPEWVNEEEAASVVATGDGGKEVEWAGFVHPFEARKKAKLGNWAFFPPQAYLIQRLCETLEKEDAQNRWDAIKNLSYELRDYVFEPWVFRTVSAPEEVELVKEADKEQGKEEEDYVLEEGSDAEKEDAKPEERPLRDDGRIMSKGEETRKLQILTLGLRGDKSRVLLWRHPSKVKRGYIAVRRRKRGEGLGKDMTKIEHRWPRKPNLC